MRKKIALYILFVLIFVVGKFLFLCFHYETFGGYALSDWMAVLWHGLPHDLTCAGYLMALPMLVQFLFIWLPGDWHRYFMRFWIRFSLLLLLVNYLVDLFLYRYWGFRLDSTALFYFLDEPVMSMRQAPVWALLLGFALLGLLWWSLQRGLCALYPRRVHGSILCLPTVKEQCVNSVACLLLCGLLFVAIRGGVTPATMNVGRVYFSSEMPLNQAATNPFFSFFHSVTHKKADFSKQYRFMSDEEAAAAYAEMNRGHVVAQDSLLTTQDSLLTTQNPLLITQNSQLTTHDSLLTAPRPNIILLILESFSGAACHAVNAAADSMIMPEVCRLYREGIGFTNIFANSFRTDRGCAAIMASYPAQPNNSVMKDQRSCDHLQYLSKRLKENGYDLGFYHGGDVNFTNMRGFLAAGGFEKVVGDTEFPVTERLSKWGVPDHLMFDYLYHEVMSETQEPFLKVMLTLSSHEPFDVAFDRFEAKEINSLAYADSCLGSFVERLKQTPLWDNLLIIGVADHSFRYYPAELQNHEILRYRIPMFWTGGAIGEPRLVDTYGSQTDLAATLLEQMGIGHSDFNFSKDLMDPTIGHYGFYTFGDGFGLVTDSCCYIQDNARSGEGLSGTDDPAGTAERWGKAYLQTLYDDLQKRGSL